MQVFLYVAVVLTVALAQTGGQSSCPKRGMDYWTPSNIASFANIEDWQECAELCAKITAPKRCEHWSWLDLTSPHYPGYCWLKESIGKYKASKHCVTGSKDCHY